MTQNHNKIEQLFQGNTIHAEVLPNSSTGAVIEVGLDGHVDIYDKNDLISSFVAHAETRNAYGTDRNDIIMGTPSKNPNSGRGDKNDSRQNNELYGRGGNDVIYGRDGDDLIDGGPGDDILFGSRGNDTVNGGDGRDILIGDFNHRDDSPLGWKAIPDGIDVLDGGKGNDLLLGLGGHDHLIGGEGNDLLVGGRGKDTYDFKTGDGIDTIIDHGESEVVIDGVKHLINIQKDQVTFDGVNISSQMIRRQTSSGGEPNISTKGDSVYRYGAGDEIHFKYIEAEADHDMAPTPTYSPLSEEDLNTKTKSLYDKLTSSSGTPMSPKNAIAIIERMYEQHVANQEMPALEQS